MMMRTTLSVLSATIFFGAAPSPAAAPPVEQPRPVAAPKVFEPGKMPELNAQNHPIRAIETEGFRIEVDLSQQMVEARAFEPSPMLRSSLKDIWQGDMVEVVTDDAALSVGDAVVAKLSRGRRIQVGKTEGEFLSATVLVDGVAKAGWVHRDKVKLIANEDRIAPTISGVANGRFVSAAMLLQKAKQFDDGLYAAVELAAQNGAGEMTGKKQWLASVVAAAARGEPNKATAVTAAAHSLGASGNLDLPAALQALSQAELAAFNADPVRSKPLGFYTWSGDLSSIFRQDRMLQTELFAGDGIDGVAAALRGDEKSRAAYERYLALVSRLTNPWNGSDLRPLLADDRPAPVGKAFRFFPPSTSHETALVMQLYGDKPIPPGFDLMNELVARIRSGQLDLTPKPNSGWYDYQTYTLETLASPEKAAESSHLRMNDEYKKLLVDLLKGSWALARETHIKQLEIPAPAAAAAPFFPPPPQRKKIYLDLELSAEPLATHYRRRADAYRFVHQVLRDAFGEAALTKLHRQTADGPVEQNLDAELQEITAIFEGAAVVAARELGLASVDNREAKGTPDPKAAGEAFLSWAAKRALDADLSKDARMMVPVFFDQQRQQLKVWVFLGWTTRDVYFDLVRDPTTKVFDASGKQLAGEAAPEIFWRGTSQSAAYPVMAEVYVNKLLDRDEFRKHCDTYQTRSAILTNLE